MVVNCKIETTSVDIFWHDDPIHYLYLNVTGICQHRDILADKSDKSHLKPLNTKKKKKRCIKTEK